MQSIDQRSTTITPSPSSLSSSSSNTTIFLSSSNNQPYSISQSASSPSLESFDPAEPLPLQYEWCFSYDDGCRKGANQSDYESR